MSESLDARRGPLLATLAALALIAGIAMLLIVGPGAVEARAATAADCVAGEYFDGSACVPAPVGTFVADDGATEPTPCPVGRFQDEPGKIECKVIPLGSGGTGGLDDGTRSTGAATCAEGTFRGEGQTNTTRCTPAPAGSFVADTGALAATLCSAGKFQDETGKTACKDAPAGTFTAASGAAAATPCPVGRFQDEPGKIECKAIPLGSGGTGGLDDGTRSTGVATCVAGTFRGEGQANTTRCTPAPAGSFVAGTGAQAATLCPAGKFQDETGKTACKDAPAGSFVPVAGAITSALCPPGNYSAAAGATACTPASVGYYVPRPGSTGQLRCITATEPGLATCPAPAAAPSAPTTEAPATGDEPLSPQGDACPPGTWSTTGTSRAGSSCIPASPGTYVAGIGATAEEPCPPGTFSDGFGATACTPAPVGTFVAGTGAMDPTPCPGATEPGLTLCPEDLSATPAVDDASSGGVSLWWWIGGLLLVLAAGGGGFLLLQRRTGMLVPDSEALEDPEGKHLTGLDATIAAPVVEEPVTPDVLEWDEAIDGTLGDETEPPPAPR